MRLSSSAFSEGAMIPRRFTCDGEDLSPPLEWSDAPADTRSFVLLCEDPDAPSGTWRHWAAYDIPPAQAALSPGDAGRAERLRFKQAISDFARRGYGGPCPPHGHGLHHYHFRLLALAVDRLALGSKPTCQDVEREAGKHILAEAVLIGVYER
jgi:Raf kinase inhibitor-like YbhB/YbcL family protein